MGYTMIAVDVDAVVLHLDLLLKHDLVVLQHSERVLQCDELVTHRVDDVFQLFQLVQHTGRRRRPAPAGGRRGQKWGAGDERVTSVPGK